MPASSDPGGLVDRTVTPFNTYSYTAERIRAVILNGQSYELHSARSPAVTFLFKDVFPPRPPTGLQSIASAPFNGPPSIDLSWDPSPEADILGYNLFRADSPGSPFRRLNPAPLPAPTFRDLTAASNHLYRYRVTAVDRNYNESAPSHTLEDEIHVP